jgi:hypothetical protein
MATTIGVLGSGQVGDVLANGFLKHGYRVVRGSRDPAKLEAWRSGAGANASTATFADAARAAEIAVLAVKGTAAEPLVRSLAGALAGKVVIDTTNPIADAPPVDGVLTLFTGPNESLMERLQALAPQARFVKAFSCVGNALMVNPELPGGPPTMFLCGNDAAARAEVTSILGRFGWGVEDLGVAAAARAIEPLVSLWCAPGFLRNDWVHAYKVLRR